MSGLKTDVQRWIDYHTQLFPGFGKYLSDNPPQIHVLGSRLAPYSVESLCAASDVMYTEETQPRGYGRHCAWMIRHMRPETLGDSETLSGPKVVDDLLVSRCPQCQDYGVANILSPGTLKRIRSGVEAGHDKETQYHEEPLLTCTIVCNCSAGRGRKGSRWSDDHCLIEYTQLLQTACDRAQEREGAPACVYCVMWRVAREQVEAFDTRQKSRPQELSGEELP